MPEPEHESRSESGFVVGMGGDEGVHEGEEGDGVVVDLDVDVEKDVAVLGEEQQFERLLESRDFLLGRLVGEELVKSVVVVLSLNASGAVGGAI